MLLHFLCYSNILQPEKQTKMDQPTKYQFRLFGQMGGWKVEAFHKSLRLLNKMAFKVKKRCNFSQRFQTLESNGKNK